MERPRPSLCENGALTLSTWADEPEKVETRIYSEADSRQPGANGGGGIPVEFLVWLVERLAALFSQHGAVHFDELGQAMVEATSNALKQVEIPPFVPLIIVPLITP